MKKSLLTVFVLLITGFAYANNNQGTFTKSNIESIELKKENTKKIIEYKIINKNGLATCYTRECWIGTKDNGNGTTSEVKVCSDWTEVPCPTGGGGASLPNESLT